MQKRFLTWMAAVSLLLGSATPVFAGPDDEPNAQEMAADVLIARPFGALVTVLGSAAFVVSLPFSALGGNVEQAAEKLVLGPGRETFVRCLGCRTSGRYQSVDD